jgi:PAS domain S-box-containing protein
LRAFAGVPTLWDFRAKSGLDYLPAIAASLAVVESIVEAALIGTRRMTDTTNAVAMMLVDLDGVVRFWSDGAEGFFGYSAADVTGRPMDFLIVSTHRERHWTGFRAAMARERIDAEQPVANAPVTCANGDVRYFPLRFVAIADPFDRPAGMLAVFGSPPARGESNGLYDLYPEAITPPVSPGA